MFMQVKPVEYTYYESIAMHETVYDRIDCFATKTILGIL